MVDHMTKIVAQTATSRLLKMGAMVMVVDHKTTFLVQAATKQEQWVWWLIT